MDNTVDNTEENMRLAREDTKERLKITRMYELKDAIKESGNFFRRSSYEIYIKKLFEEYFELNYNNSLYIALLRTVELVNCKFKAEIVLDIIKPKFYKFCIEKNLLDEDKNFGDFTIEDIKNLEESEDKKCSKLAGLIINALIRPYEYEKTTTKTTPIKTIPFRMPSKNFSFKKDSSKNEENLNLFKKNVSTDLKPKNPELDDSFDFYGDFDSLGLDDSFNFYRDFDSANPEQDDFLNLVIDSESKNLSQSIKLQSFGFAIKGFDSNSKKRQKE